MSRNQSNELTRDLASRSSPDLSLLILQQPDKGSNQFLLDNSLSNTFCQIDKLVCDHVPNPPALVGYGITDRLEHMFLCLCCVEVGGDSDQIGDGKESDGILIIGR